MDLVCGCYYDQCVIDDSDGICCCRGSDVAEGAVGRVARPDLDIVAAFDCQVLQIDIDGHGGAVRIKKTAIRLNDARTVDINH